MASEKIRFTRAVVAAIEPPASGRAYYRDAAKAGVVLDVTANRVKAFQLYRKIGGRPVRIVLGRLDPDLSESRELGRDQAVGKAFDPLAYIGNTPRLNVRMARALAVAVSAFPGQGRESGGGETGSKAHRGGRTDLEGRVRSPLFRSLDSARQAHV